MAPCTLLNSGFPADMLMACPENSDRYIINYVSCGWWKGKLRYNSIP